MGRKKAGRLLWGKVREYKGRDGSKRYYAEEPLGNGKYQRAEEPFRTRTAAEEWLRTREQEAKAGDIVLSEAGNEPFKLFFDRWLAIRYKRMMADPPTLTVKSYQDYESPGRNYLIPLFGNQIMSKIDDKVIAEFQKALNETDANGKRLIPARPAQKCERIASWVCNFAVREGAIAKNWFNDEKVVRNNKKFTREWHDITSDQVEMCVANCEHNSLAIYLGSYVGLRAGEIWGLKMKSVHLKYQRIEITHSFTEVSDKHIRDDMRVRKGVRCGPPKPQREKHLDFPSFLVPMIEAHVNERKAQGAKPHDWLFVDPNGLPVRHSTWYSSFLRPAMDAAEMDSSEDFHTFRHFCGSWYLHQGYPPFIVQRMLDHTEEEMTAHYSHLLAGVAAAWHKKADEAYAAERAEQAKKIGKVVPMTGSDPRR